MYAAKRFSCGPGAERRDPTKQFYNKMLFYDPVVLVQSGGIFEATSFAKPCEVSRVTIHNYLAVLEATFVAAVVRPYHSNKAVEIVAAPKVYGFDTGFVCAFRGWKELRQDDLGVLWEHYVLNEIHSLFPGLKLQYWRDKQKHEIDFVLASRPSAPPVAIECKWSADAFDAANLRIFRRHYPKGKNLVVAHDVKESYTRSVDGLQTRFTGLPNLAEEIGSSPVPAGQL
jgi:uncharacterized protein